MFKKIRASASSLLGMSSRWPSARRPGLPHIGKKEQERAKRCRMVTTHPNGVPRTAATMEQMSKREYAERELANAS